MCRSMAKIETGFSHKRLQWKIDDEQLANYPSYGRWPVRCCGCGFPGRAETTEVNGFTFLCRACVKPNRPSSGQHDSGSSWRVRIVRSFGHDRNFGCSPRVAGYCASWHNNDFSSFGRDSSQKIKAANITTAALRRSADRES